MATSQNPNPKPHAIMISLHLQGHITPFVDLAIALASRGFSITFAHLDFIHQRITASSQTDIFAHARSSAAGLDIRYFTISDGLPLDSDREADSEVFLDSFVNRLPDIVDEFVGGIINNNHSSSDSSSLPSNNYFLLADTLAIWAPKIAKKYGLLHVSFWTEPALVFSLYYHLDLLRQNGDVPVNGRRKNVDYIPGIPSINTKDFVSYFHDSELTSIHQIMFGAFDLVKSADFVVCNTVEELESEAIAALREKIPFYAVGPVFQLNSVKPHCSIARSLLPESDCSEWLISRPAGSVLYVSFGSLARTDKHVIRAIAGGLLISGVNFLWAIRPGLVDSDEGILPDGFEEMIEGRGLRVPWCNQSRVLANPAVGGFLTHCGWNSILESVWNGVPMICYPLFTDQITNRKLVVDDWKIGMNLCNGEGIAEEDVAESIGKLMSGGSKSVELRQEIEKVRKILHNALSEDGSSVGNFDSFCQKLCGALQRSCV